MTTDCRQVRERAWQGEWDGADRHLAGCPACRDEAALARRLIGELAIAREVEPPAHLDAEVQRILEDARGRHRRVRPAVIAGGLGLIAGTAWLTGLAVMLSETSLGESAPLVAAAIAVVYLIVSSGAMVPLLLHSTRHTREEVRA